jgi:putative serine protease PepD
MPVETTPTPVLRPRRTWRDLPATPPVADFLPPPDPEHLIAPPGEPGEEPPAQDPGRDADTSAEKPRRKRVWLVAGAAAAVMATVGAVVWSQGESSGTSPTTPTVAEPSDPGSTSSVQDVAKALGPAVVQIEIGQGLGSGVIYDSSGLILTAHHVVAGADEVTVRTADEQELPGRVVGRAPERDLAIVAVSPSTELTAAPLAEPGSVEVGETAIALGSPFGFQQTVTSGIVSGLDRELESPVGTLTGLIQTDAPINPGNSGGPLADASAEVIGINTAIASASGGSDGVGFAVPVEDAKDLMDQVAQAGGVDAPTVSDPGGSGGLNDLGLPGLDGLLPDGVPGLEDLQDLLPGLGLDGLLPDLGNGSMDQLLRDMLDQLFPGLGDLFGEPGSEPSQPGPGQPAPGQEPAAPSSPSALSLVEVPEPPAGYEQLRSTTRTEENGGVVEGTQLIVLEGPDGQVSVAAERSADTADRFADLEGSETTVNGQPAIEMDNGIAFLTDDDLLVIVRGGGQVSADDVAAVAEAVEVQ